MKQLSIAAGNEWCNTYPQQWLTIDYNHSIFNWKSGVSNSHCNDCSCRLICTDWMKNKIQGSFLTAQVSKKDTNVMKSFIGFYLWLIEADAMSQPQMMHRWHAAPLCCRTAVASSLIVPDPLLTIEINSSELRCNLIRRAIH